MVGTIPVNIDHKQEIITWIPLYQDYLHRIANSYGTVLDISSKKYFSQHQMRKTNVEVYIKHLKVLVK